MSKTRYIVIPLYDHTGDEEIAEILDAIQGIGIDGAYVVTGKPPAADTSLRPRPGESAEDTVARVVAAVRVRGEGAS
jgi:hypothetical protein